MKAGDLVIQSNTFNEGTTIATVTNMKDMIFEDKVDETEGEKTHPKKLKGEKTNQG